MAAGSMFAGDDCAVCLSPLVSEGKGIQTLPCTARHLIHEDCVTAMRRNAVKAQCPACREELQGYDSKQVLTQKAILAFRREEFGLAIALQSEACDLDPQCAKSHHLLGLMWQCDGAPTSLLKAEHHFLVAASELSYVDSLPCLSEVYMSLSKPQEALRFSLQAYYQGVQGAASHVASLYMFLGNADEAQRYAKVASDGGSARGSDLCALFAEDRGQDQLAREFHWKALAQGSTTAPMQLFLSFLEEEMEALETNDLQNATRAQEQKVKMIFRMLRDGDELVLKQLLPLCNPESKPEWVEVETLPIGTGPIQDGNMVRTPEGVGVVLRQEAGGSDEDPVFVVLVGFKGERRVKRSEMWRLQSLGEYSQSHHGARGKIRDQLSQLSPSADIEQTGQTGERVAEEDLAFNSAINTRMSQTIFNLPKPVECFQAIIFKVQRPSKRINELLEESDDPHIASIRDALRGRWELESKAKIFVPPDHYEAVLQEIERQDLKLYAEHIVASPELGPVLSKLLRPHFYFKKGYQHELEVSPVAAAEEAQMSWVDGGAKSDLPVKFGFIHYRVPSSLGTLDTCSNARTA
mmetsp:Transcript_76886/g.135450  ORF Transcript_76886/g.135450 Transcript_76886/m.135450 type:complete len:579 (+) Transcript_76886:87-1823(+)